MMKTVLGIDLSLTSTGLAVAEDGRIVWTQAVKTKSEKGLIGTDSRLTEIVRSIRGAVDRVSPYLAVIESPSFASKFGSPDERSGLRWRTINMLIERGVLIAEVSPQGRAKYGTGNGRSKKPEVHAAVKAQYGRDDLPIKTDDEGDAVLLAAMGARALGMAVDTGDLTDAQLEPMEKVAWPI